MLMHGAAADHADGNAVGHEGGADGMVVKIADDAVGGGVSDVRMLLLRSTLCTVLEEWERRGSIWAEGGGVERRMI